MAYEFWKTIEGRRSVYAIGDEAVIPDEKVLELVKNALKLAPSAFNSQSARTLVLFGDAHKRLWNEVVANALRGVMGGADFTATAEKLASFAAGRGTVLFFEDQAVVEGLQNAFALYKDNFPVWSLQSSGMAQLTLWTALEAEGYGASLQHYNPLIDAEVARIWNVPTSWKLWSQMVFGSVIEAPAPKQFAFSDAHVLTADK